MSISSLDFRPAARPVQPSFQTSTGKHSVAGYPKQRPGLFSPVVSQALKAGIRFGITATSDYDAWNSYQTLMRYSTGNGRFNLMDFQKAGISQLYGGHNIVVSAPTGCGKTLLAKALIEGTYNPTFATDFEWAQPKNLRQNSTKRIFYTTPRKALSNQKLVELIQDFGVENVGLMTGDHTIKGRNAPIVIMTTEVLTEMLTDPRQQRQIGKSVAGVIFDECHFIDDADRGPVWEQAMMLLPNSVQQVHLSASVGNAPQYVKWLNKLATTNGSGARASKLVVHPAENRPVQLNYLVFDRESSALSPARSGGAFTATFHTAFETGESELKLRPLIASLSSYNKESLFPAAIVAFSRPNCDASFKDAIHNQRKLTDRDEVAKLERLIEEFKKHDRMLDVNPDLEDGLKKGYGVHHAGMSPTERLLVEKALEAGLVKVLFSTDTIGVGLNVPLKTVVFTQYSKRIKDDQIQLRVSDFQQISGRAGRLGLDKEGYVVIVPRRGTEAEQVMDLIKAGPENLASKFKPTVNMTLSYLEHHGPEALDELMRRSFKSLQRGDHGRYLSHGQQTLTGKMLKLGLLEDPNGLGRPRPTKLGKDVAKVPDAIAVPMMLLLEQPEDFLHLKDEEVVSLIAALLNNKGKAVNPLPTDYPEPFRDLIGSLRDRQNETFCDLYGPDTENPSEINCSYSPFIRDWYRAPDKYMYLEIFMHDTEYRLDDSERYYVGEFIHLTRRTANIIRKMSKMDSFDEATKKRFQRISQQLLQPPVQFPVDRLVNMLEYEVE